MTEMILMGIILVLCLVGWFGGRAGYYSGFCDGCNWMADSGHPSKPADKWWGWEPMRTIRDNAIRKWRQ